ncbi:MAG: hypothetical protein QM802_00455 [Agriterribacter sp.]
MTLSFSNILRIAVCSVVAFICHGTAHTEPLRLNKTFQARDTVPSKTDTSRVDTLKYPISDRLGDKLTSSSNNSFDLKDPANITDSIVYDPKEKKYYIIEKIGNKYYRKPTSLTFEEFNRIQARKQEVEYFQQRANTISLMNRSLLKPKLTATDDLFNRLFGSSKFDIRPREP